MTSFAPVDQRLYGAAQQLILAHLAGTEPLPGDPRGVVLEQDAVDALLLSLVAIQDQVQSGGLPPSAAFRIAALLMVVRDYIRPLPGGITEDGTDLLTADIGQLVEVVRLSRRG